MPHVPERLLLGPGPTVGHMLAAHSRVDKIAFTGGTVTGRKIMAAATGNIKKVTLELGGKSPCIVFADSDFDMAIERQPEPKGDRVKLTLSGKFLPYKEY